MAVDIIIGERITSLPLRICQADCHPLIERCQSCLNEVREEQQPDAPPIETATAQGIVIGGYNFIDSPGGFYDRWLRETKIAEQFPFLGLVRTTVDAPDVYAIPSTLGPNLHKLAVQIELGQVVTSYPKNDAEYTCWLAWWCIFAIATYGPRAAIQFS